MVGNYTSSECPSIALSTSLDLDLLIFGETLKFLSNLGFIVLLFLAGLEFDFQILQERGKGAVLKGIVIFIMSYVLSVIFMLPLGLGIGAGGPFMVGLIISTTFVGIVATTLREVGLADMNYRQNIIIIALMADISITIMLVLIPLSAKADLFSLALSMGIYIPVTFLVFYIAYRMGSLAMWHFPKTLSRFFHGKDPSELGVRATFMFLFFFIVLTLAFGIEAILGAFLAGMLFSLLFHEGALLSKKLFGLGYGFLIPVFFIQIGSRFDYSMLWNPTFLWLVPYILMVGILNKVLPSLIFLKEHSIKKVLAMGILNSSRLGLMIAAVTLAINYKLVSESMLSPIILVAMILCLACPTAFKKMMSNEPKEKGFEEARASESDGASARKKDHIDTDRYGEVV
jgi:Kef-type K+ transport system membrane component KefB